MTATVAPEAVDSDASEDDDPDRLRRIVARERRRLAAIAVSTDRSAATARRHNDAQDEVSREIARLNLSAEDLREMVELDRDFAWQRPLSRTAVIAHLNPAAQPETQQVQQLQRQQQQQQRLPQPPQRQQPQQQQQVADRLGEANLDRLDRPERQHEQQQLQPPQQQQQQQQQQQVAEGPSDTQHFAIGTDDLSHWPAALESFNLEADDSEEAESNASLGDAEADDAYWTNELYAEAPDDQQAGEQWPRSPSVEGGSPAKRHRPG